MKKALRWLGRTWPVLIWGIPLVGAAAGLVPCGYDPGSSSFLIATGCNLCYFGQLIQNVMNFLVLISLPIVAFLFFYAGVVWVTSGGSPSKLIHGKKILSSAIIGFILVCTAWLIVQTIVVGLATNTTIFTGGNWSTLNCVDKYDATKTRPRDKSLSDLLNFSSNGGGGVVTPGGGGGGGGGGGTPSSTADAQARATLAASCQNGNTNCFTYTSSGNCSDQTNAACTSLQGIQSKTLLELTQLEQNCGCTINITGGTEVGHGTAAVNVHTSGQAVDISPNAQLNSIITGYPSVGTVSAGGVQQPAYRAPDGTLYINEGTHWHLQVPNGSA